MHPQLVSHALVISQAESRSGRQGEEDTTLCESFFSPVVQKVTGVPFLSHCCLAVTSQDISTGV